MSQFTHDTIKQLKFLITTIKDGNHDFVTIELKTFLKKELVLKRKIAGIFLSHDYLLQSIESLVSDNKIPRTILYLDFDNTLGHVISFFCLHNSDLWEHLVNKGLLIIGLTSRYHKYGKIKRKCLMDELMETGCTLEQAYWCVIFFNNKMKTQFLRLQDDSYNYTYLSGVAKALILERIQSKLNKATDYCHIEQFFIDDQPSEILTANILLNKAPMASVLATDLSSFKDFIGMSPEQSSVKSKSKIGIFPEQIARIDPTRHNTL